MHICEVKSCQKISESGHPIEEISDTRDIQLSILEILLTQVSI